ncbi:polymorphic toxin-type HINT domain-containing protein, partial [Kitasatospora sp. NPDC001539]|uniref:polymorphic toxin-type HINT domain-containing protein n=1 Tax=Kitasatospora sp. NPDC001539 TaxID=3154384 RepID=UPI0033236384
FVGGTKDDATGLTNLGAREYQPTTGRFLSPDPIIDLASPQQWNAYAYSNNDPTNLSDASGLRPDGEVGGFGRTVSHGLTETWSPDGNGGWDWHEDVVYGDMGQDHPFVVHNTINFNVSNGRRKPASSWSAEAVKPGGNATWAAVTHFVGEVTGVNDAVNCANGSLQGCLATGLNLIGYNKARLAARAAEALAKEAFPETEHPSISRGCKDGNSFAPNTPVLLSDGTAKTISDLQPGDKVIATDPETGTTNVEPVTNTIVGSNDRDFTDLTISAPSDPSKSSTITSTQKHPYWDETTRHWTNANELKAGDYLRSADGETATVLQVHNYRTNPQSAHNLTIADVHTYYVLAGTTPVLVHNTGPGCGQVVYGASKGVGQDLKRSATVGNDQWQFNTGHGFDRAHTGPGGVTNDLRTTGLTPDEIEQGIVSDAYSHMANGGAVPRVGSPGFSGPLERQVRVGGFNIGYRVSQTPDNVYRVATYWLNP